MNISTLFIGGESNEIIAGLHFALMLASGNQNAPTHPPLQVIYL